MVKFTLHRDRCKACGVCIAHCPKKLLKEGEELNALMYRAVVQSEPEKCNGCGICAMMCPDVCFEIYKTTDAPTEVAK